MELQPNLQQNNIAFVLGNGKSRLEINAANLLSKGKVYGCNAQYREYDPHYLIAVDAKMVNEIVESGYHQTHEVWTNPSRNIKNKENLNFFSPSRGWSSGPTALLMAANSGYKDIYILGFDYQGIQGKLNNVYADTKNYRSSNDTATYFGNWLHQTEWVIKEFRNINFYRVINKNGYIPDKLNNKHKNLKHIDYIDFKNKIFPEENLINQSKTDHLPPVFNLRSK
jgi:virulence-associated protein VapD